MDIYAGPAPPAKFAHIEGVIKNTGNKNLRNILIKYSVGLDSLSASVNMLPAGGSLNFTTNSVRVRSINPQYMIKDVRYEIDEMP